MAYKYPEFGTNSLWGVVMSFFEILKFGLKYRFKEAWVGIKFKFGGNKHGRIYEDS